MPWDKSPNAVEETLGYAVGELVLQPPVSPNAEKKRLVRRTKKRCVQSSHHPLSLNMFSVSSFTGAMTPVPLSLPLPAALPIQFVLPFAREAPHLWRN